MSVLSRIGNKLGIKTGSQIVNKEIVKTGYLLFDQNVPFKKGGWSEIWGTESSGKTTFAYSFFGKLQKEGWLTIICDFEGSFSTQWAAKQGLEVEDKDIVAIYAKDSLEDSLQPLIDTLKKIEEVMSIEEAEYAALVEKKATKEELQTFIDESGLLKYKNKIAVVIDTLNALPEKALSTRESVGEKTQLEAETPGRFAMGVGKFLKVTNAIMGRLQILGLILGQARDVLNIGGPGGGGLSSTGGHAKKHGMDNILKFFRSNSSKRIIKDKAGKIIQFEVDVTVVKTRGGNETKFPMVFLADKGFDPWLDVLDIALTEGIITAVKMGTYKYKDIEVKAKKDERITKLKEAFIDHLEEIKQEVVECLENK